MFKTVFAITVSVALLSLFFSPFRRNGAAADVEPAACTQKSAVPQDADFKGKTLALQVASSVNGGERLCVVEEAKIRKIDGRSFLVGKVVNFRGGWPGGTIVWIKIDRVDSISEFASVDEFKKAIAEAYVPMTSSSSLSLGVGVPSAGPANRFSTPQESSSKK